MTKILFIEDAAAAASIRGGSTDIGSSSVLDYDLVIYRQSLEGSAAYEVLKCRFEHPEAFIMSLVADTGSKVEGETPAAMAAEPANVNQSETLVHMSTPGVTLAVRETRAEIARLLVEDPVLDVTAFITTQPGQQPTPENPDGVPPSGEWDTITLVASHISHLSDFRL